MDLLSEAGTIDDTMFVISSGAVAVCVLSEHTRDVTDNEVARLRAGEYFGELSLFLGESFMCALLCARVFL